MGKSSSPGVVLSGDFYPRIGFCFLIANIGKQIYRPLRVFLAEWYPSYSAFKTASRRSGAVFNRVQWFRICPISQGRPWARCRALSPGPKFKRADVAQLVEQLIRNQQVIGSSPIVGSNLSIIQHRKISRRDFVASPNNLTVVLLSFAQGSCELRRSSTLRIHGQRIGPTQYCRRIAQRLTISELDIS